MISGSYRPSFFSRGVWALLGINSFIGVLFGDGSKESIMLAGALLTGNILVFAFSFKKGSRDFGLVEKISLLLLVIATGVWIIFDAPFLTLIISLVAHFIGGIPTIWRVVKDPSTEQAVHWYFFFVASVIAVFASEEKIITAILFPIYFACFDGLIILLANRNSIIRIPYN